MEWTLAVVALALLGYAGVSRALRGTPISAAMVFTAVGLLVGPKVLDLVTASSTGESVRVLAEAALTLVLFGDASRLDLHRLRHELALPARLLGIGLPLTIVARGAVRGARLRVVHGGGGGRARGAARADGRGARAGRRHRAARCRPGSARA